MNVGPAAPILAVAVALAGVQITPETPAALNELVDLMGAPGLWALLAWIARRALKKFESMEARVEELTTRVAVLEVEVHDRVR